VNPIWNAWLNFYETNDVSSTGLSNFVLEQDNWVRAQVKAYSTTSDYWAQVGLIMNQLDGLIQGYADHASPHQQISYVEQLYLQLQPEIGDIMTHLSLKETPSYNEIRIPQNFNSHCSVLIKVSPDGNTLYAAHDTWSGYDTMLRTYKYYQLNYKLPSLKSPLVAFSSYPGNLQSTDDFYITTQKLFVAETTNDVFNNTLYGEISPQSVPEWVRIIVANRMATSGPEWAAVYQENNSGTYNNQWQVVDFKLFTPGQPLQPNTLWIVEQIPGTIMAADETPVMISKGYWPSYNIPFFPFIYNTSGYPAVYNLYGNTFSYSECARAQIFRRDAPSVANMDNMKSIMRYNQFQRDPLSLRDACRSISARCDLNTPWSNNTLNGFSAFGGIDSKIVDNTLIENFSAWAVSGPTTDSQPPFAWTKTWEAIPHYGMPYLYDFPFQIMSPNF